jgi:hypothetical protein
MRAQFDLCRLNLTLQLLQRLRQYFFHYVACIISDFPRSNTQFLKFGGHCLRLSRFHPFRLWRDLLTRSALALSVATLPSLEGFADAWASRPAEARNRFSWGREKLRPLQSSCFGSSKIH